MISRRLPKHFIDSGLYLHNICRTFFGRLAKLYRIETVLTLFLLFSILSSSAFGQAGLPVQQPEIPNQFSSRMDEYLFYDNNFNVVQRLRTEEKVNANLMSEEDKAPVSVLIFEADFEKIKDQISISKMTEENDFQKVRSASGKIYIPCLEKDQMGAKILALKFGKPSYRTQGRKVLSRATYYIEPVGPTGGFFAKFVPHLPGLDQKLEREILINDYIKTQLSELPVEMRNLSMDSFMTVNLSIMGIPISVAYRSADRILNDKPENIKTFPGHGLLGCEACVQKFGIIKTGQTDPEKAADRWKTLELLPKLARYLAYAHHVLGVSFEAHTQNIVFDIDTTTGEIKNIYFRDFADILLNPIPLLAHNRLPTDIEWNRVKLLSIHPNYFSDQSVQIAKDIWYHVSIYSGQSITSHIKGFQRQQRHLLTFLKAYLTETELILGHSIPLTPDALRVIENLENKTSKEDFYSGELLARSPLRNAMASVLKPVFEFAHRVKIEKIESDLQNAVTQQNEAKLRKTFFRAVILQKVIFMGQDERALLLGQDNKMTWLKSTIQVFIGLGLNRYKQSHNLDFKILDQRIWALDKETKKPIAVMVEPYRESVSWIEKISNQFQPQWKYSGGSVRCNSIFSGGRK